ncbi:MAG: hypothetical protein KDB53_06020, partial [Planctomycetes bacterium]|nr:hypothetical protein [Planctomycetota bacterium]
MTGLRIVLLGHSRAGLSLAGAWQGAGHEIVATWNRSSDRRANGLVGPPPQLVSTDLTDLNFDAVCVAVRDDAIAEVAARIVLPPPTGDPRQRPVIFHLSGSQSTSILA